MSEKLDLQISAFARSDPPQRNANAAPPPSASAIDDNHAPIYSTAQFTQSKTHSPTPPRHDPFARSLSRQRRGLRSRRRNEWAWVILAGGLISVFGILIIAMIVLLRVPQSAQVAIPTADLTPVLPTPVDARHEFIADGRIVGIDVLPLENGTQVEVRSWSGDSRYSIIVGGLDRRPGDDKSLTYLTDTLMLVSINPAENSVGVLSIPRDLWVEVPGEEERHRINRANLIGEIRNPGGGGPFLLQQTVSLNLGMRVHNYLLMDFQALIDIVDALDGIDITINYTINDDRFPDMNYGYDPFYLPAGTHHLDGYDALRFARTRHGNNDVLRAQRQQEVLYAIRDRILGMDFVQLLFKVPAILQTLSDNIYTGLSYQEIIELAIFAKDINFDDISMGVINFDYLEEFVTEDQQQVLIPRQGLLDGLLRKTFGDDYSGYRN